jgi:hypothetical protein
MARSKDQRRLAQPSELGRVILTGGLADRTIGRERHCAVGAGRGPADEPPADPGKDPGTVAQDDTVPVVSNVMVTAGISQLPRIDWPLAEITETLRRVYIQMWKVRGV